MHMNCSTSCAYWIKWGGGIGCAEAFWDTVFLILVGKILISWRSLVQALNKLEPNYKPIFRWLKYPDIFTKLASNQTKTCKQLIQHIAKTESFLLFLQCGLQIAFLHHTSTKKEGRYRCKQQWHLTQCLSPSILLIHASITTPPKSHFVFRHTSKRKNKPKKLQCTAFSLAF